MKHLDPEFRFWQKVDLDFDTGCWNWIARKNSDGYGEFAKTHNVVVKSHRFSYETFVGKIPIGLEIDHLCRNRACVNPKHLEAVTHKENILRGNGLGVINANKTHCVNGHPFRGDNLVIRSSGKGRQCRICKNASARKRWRETRNAKN